MMILQHTVPNHQWESAKIIYPPEMQTGEYMAPK
jgi:hypothetical protein